MKTGDIIECRYTGQNEFEYIQHRRDREEADTDAQVEGESCDKLQEKNRRKTDICM